MLSAELKAFYMVARLGSITLAAERRDHRVALSVRDTGPGIPAEFHEAVFEKFKQLDNFLTREHGGTGLGLALVKQLTEHMGGEILLESSPGQGSCFTILLPLKDNDD